MLLRLLYSSRISVMSRRLLLCILSASGSGVVLLVTRALRLVAQCIVIGPVCLYVGVFVGLLP